VSWALPSGTVTFVFTDVEGSTKLLHELGAEAYADALTEHRRAVRDAFTAHGGVEVDTQGDAFFHAFPTASGALAAAAEATEALAGGPLRVRMGVHTGTPLLSDEGYVGTDVHRAARIAAAGHGGQVLVSAATRQLVERNLTDLGEHRLKDLSAPERIYQLGEQQFPPVKSLYRTNLPVPATPFVGRERELAEVLDLLGGGELRLLTLTGPGGAGKTRLALQAAGAAADAFPDGVFWVPLAALRDPDLVLEVTARTLGADDGLAAHVADKSLLVLLDNFEHLIDAAEGVAELLTACPSLRILVTSRESLRLPGEQAYPVPPLQPQDSRELFLARARAADPGFAASDAVGELCLRLDNLPLALELAAARIRVLSSEQLVDRLGQRLDLLKAGRGAEPRQQTLRATLEWSHDLLDDDEKRLFARLALFRGGCTLEAAEQVSGADLDVLESLVDKSLLRRTEDRFWMLETIREYAAEQLDDGGLARRHAEHYLALAEDVRARLLRGDPKPWLDRLEAEHDNLRAALDYFADTGTGELEQRLAAALWRFWQWRGHLAEGRRRLERAARADARPTEARAWALFGAAVLAGDSRDPAVSRPLFEQALPLFEELGDAHAGARVRMNLGMIALQEGDLERARTLSEEAVRTFEELGDEDFIAVSTRNLGYAHSELGDRERAHTLQEEVVRRARAIGNVHLEGQALGELAELEVEEGRAGQAVPFLRESTRIFRELADPIQSASNLSILARVLVVSSRAEAAAQVLARAEATFDELGVHRMVRFNPATREMIQAQLDDAAYADARARGEELTLDEAIELALESLDR
jgi:predicted ATPase/class 3 adenylate cyclase